MLTFGEQTVGLARLANSGKQARSLVNPLVCAHQPAGSREELGEVELGLFEQLHLAVVAVLQRVDAVVRAALYLSAEKEMRKYSQS